ncbi:MAG TPA: hypothetical protein PLX62_06795 [Bacteroidales bacterium]|nr:hypothetical protein [Bacteroidales bacterium]
MRNLLLTISLWITTLICSATTYYVATPANGGSNSNPGTLAQPFATWQYAIDQMGNGDTTFVRGGVYYITGTNNFVFIDGTASGTASERCFFGAYQPDFDAGNHPILDCSQAYETYGTNFSCFGLNAVEYWHIKGITVRNAYQRGLANRRPQGFGATLSANLKFENCTAHNISARGFYYSSGAWNTWDAENANTVNPQYAMWNSDTTYFINCDAYDIRDSINCSSGDGWKCHSYFGKALIFEGCRAWDFSDDGFDPSGAGKRVFKNCWAMSGNKYSSLCSGNIEGNGFKTSAVGAEQIGHYPQEYSFVEVSNCIAAYCMGYGFYNNLELGADNNAQYFNNTSYHNYGGYFDVPLVLVNTRGIEMRNNLAYDNSSTDYEQAGIYNPSVYTESNNTWVATQETGAGSWPGWILNTDYTVTDADFVSLDSSQIRGARKADWSLPDITFLKLASTSDLIDGGIDVGLPYSGAAPDLGYSEFYNKKAVFIHHSSGGNWVADSWGGLGDAMNDAGYFFSGIDYGWDAPYNTNIGDYTDIGDWWTWFMDQTVQGNSETRRDNIMGAVYTEYDKDIQFGDYTRTLSDPGGENEIIMFKSCYPNSDIIADNATNPEDIYGDPAGSNTYTETNVRALYDTILTYFKANPGRMFVVITAPPLSDATNAARARSFNNWLVYDWLQDADWENKNVYVWDWYNVLTGVNNHHRVEDGVVVHTIASGSGNVAIDAYIDGDDHPNAVGCQKSTTEFVPVLDVWYSTWSNHSPPPAPAGDSSIVKYRGLIFKL